MLFVWRRDDEVDIQVFPRLDRDSCWPFQKWEIHLKVDLIIAAREIN